MLVVKLLGGLGNQMFQYAFGLSLEQARGQAVHFDTIELLDRSYKEQFIYRDFELGIFSRSIPVATSFEVNLFTYQPIGLVERAYYKAQRCFRQPSIYKEKQYYVYDSGVRTTHKNTYFEGYWQSEQYFDSYASLIRQAFAFKSNPSERNVLLARQLSTQNAVSVHIRRGDYVSNPLSNHVHGTCTPAYYEQAVRYITSRVSDAVLYVFSDEPDWVRQHMKFSYPTVYVSHNQGKDSFEDLRLMSLCQHHIIANSSFSWWGAWLNASPTKIVVAPQQWMNGVTETGDLIPASWIQL